MERGGRPADGGQGQGTGGRRNPAGDDRAAAEPIAAIRPPVSFFKLHDNSLQLVAQADFGEALGEVRDIAPVRDAAGKFQCVTIMANDLKPERSARLAIAD